MRETKSLKFLLNYRIDGIKFPISPSHLRAYTLILGGLLAETSRKYEVWCTLYNSYSARRNMPTLRPHSLGNSVSSLVNVISGCLFPFLLRGSICPNNCPRISSLNVLWDFYIVEKDSHAAPFRGMNPPDATPSAFVLPPYYCAACTLVIVQRTMSVTLPSWIPY